jgi:hypothetical protein
MFRFSWKFWLIQLIILMIIQVILLTYCVECLSHTRRTPKERRANPVVRCTIPPEVLSVFADMLSHLLGIDYFERRILRPYLMAAHPSLRILVLRFRGAPQNIINDKFVATYPQHQFFTNDLTIRAASHIKTWSGQHFDLIYSLFDGNAPHRRNTGDLAPYVRKLRRACKIRSLAFVRLVTCNKVHARYVVRCFEHRFAKVRIGFVNYQFLMPLNLSFLPVVLKHWSCCKDDFFTYGQLVVLAQA